MDVLQAAAGRQFTTAVRESISQLKGGDPLHGVTVIVPSNTAGLSLRRVLGSNLLDAQAHIGPSGIANVSFATPFQHASTLAAPVLAAQGTRPLTTAVLSASVRHVLAEIPGRFARVAQHTATESALVRSYAELTQIPQADRTLLAERGSERTRDLVLFVDAVHAHLAGSGERLGYHDEFAVFEAARAIATQHPASEASVLLAGPFDIGHSGRVYLRALAQSWPGHALIALSGDKDVDDHSVTAMAEMVGVPATATSVPTRLPNQLIPVADGDEEVRAIVRQVAALAERGARFDRIAVLHPTHGTYPRALREQFDQAGIPTAGPDHRRLADSMAGRLLGRILQLGASSGREKLFSRAAVLELAAAAPLRGPTGRPLRSGSWEELSRRAGVVGGLEDWQTKLTRYAEAHQRNLEEPRNSDRSEGWFETTRRELTASAELLSFVEWIDERTTTSSVEPNWQARSAWVRSVFDELLPQANRRTSWPEAELVASEKIEQILARIGVLDDVQPNASFPAFVRAIELELDAPSGSRGRFGTGVLVSSLAAAAMLDVDHVFVLGMAEGICPRPIREDTLIPDADRQLLRGKLPVREDRLLDQRRQFLFGAAAATESLVMLMPTGDHRNGRDRTPSRWWIEAMRKLSGSDEIATNNWRHAELAELQPELSFQGAASQAFVAGEAASLGDALMQRGVAELPPRDRGVVRGAETTELRSTTFSAMSGDLSDAATPPALDETRPLSASRLEAWASCPRKYFFGEVLDLGEIEATDRIEEISAMDRGTVWHEILEKFISTALPGGPNAPASPEHSWTDADRARLLTIADEVFTEAERSGITGRALLWEIEKERLRGELITFLDRDSAQRAEMGCTPAQVELAVGIQPRDGSPAHPPVEVPLPDGRTVRLRGFIDRVDTRSDGTPVVFDYKTSKSISEKALEEDPVLGGTKLQLGVYAEAVQMVYRAPRSSAWYWFNTSNGRFARRGYEWGTDQRATFVNALSTIVEGIDSGLFPPIPGGWGDFFGEFDNCRYCDFRTICSRNRQIEYDHAMADERLAPFVRMTEPNTDEAAS